MENIITRNEPKESNMPIQLIKEDGGKILVVQVNAGARKWLAKA
jgi:hypothetical protein